MTEQPLFVSTSHGEVAALVSIPDADGIRDDVAAILFTGDASSRTRVGVLATAAEALARSGIPVLRFDYPGAGLSESVPRPPNVALAEVASEVVGWFRDQTEAEQLLVGGHCLGARLALYVASQHEEVSATVAIGCPIKKRQIRPSRARAKLASSERVGPIASRVMVKGKRTKGSSDFYPGLIEEIVAAGRRGRICFVYGSEDEFREDLTELLEDVPPDVRESVVVEVLPGAQLRALTDLDDHPWVVDRMVESLTGSVGD